MVTLSVLYVVTAAGICMAQVTCIFSNVACHERRTCPEISVTFSITVVIVKTILNVYSVISGYTNLRHASWPQIANKNH